MIHALIVDDEPLIRRGLTAMLQQTGHPFATIRTAEHGVQALQKIRTQCPDLLFTDIRMPRMDGLELCRHVHDQFPQVKIVVISGHEDFEYARQCIGFGVKEYLLKPVMPHDVARILQQLKNEMTATLSVSWVDEWIERTVSDLWEMRRESFDERLSEWKAYLLATNLREADFFQLLNDGLSTVKKRMAARQFHAETYGIEMGADKEEAIQQFEDQLRGMAHELVLQRQGQDLVQEAVRFIDLHLAQDVTLEVVAERVGLTPQYFCLLFKKSTKETFIQYRTRKRMERARQLLALPQYRTTDVAMEVGYNNYPHFSKTFKKATGFSPQAYRQRIGIK